MPDHDTDTASLDAAESRFQRALRTSDVDTLDGLLHAEARYLGPDGNSIDKATDLDAHQSGLLKLTTVEELHREVQVIDAVGITRVHLHLIGRAGDQEFDAVLAYTRTWIVAEGLWRIVAAHGSPVPTAT